MKNLGPKSRQMLREVDIETLDELRAVGAAMAYRMLRHRHGAHVNALFLYALEGALQGRHWNDFSPEEKARLKAEADGDLGVGTR